MNMTKTNKTALALAIALGLSLMGLKGVPLAHADGNGSDGYAHHVVIHVDEDNADKMNLVLNNVVNITQHYAGQNEKVQIEIVAYGPGLTMLRDDTSPVKARLADFMPSFPNVTFAACGNTMKGVAKKEGKEPPIIQSDSISVVTAGVVQIMTRQDQGWHYIRP